VKHFSPPELPEKQPCFSGKESLRIAIVMPVLIRTVSLWAATLKTLRALHETTRKSWLVSLKAHLSVHVVANRIEVPGDAGVDLNAPRLLDAIGGNMPGTWFRQVIDEGDKHVPGGWNCGIVEALKVHADFVLVIANDVTVDDGFLEELVTFGMEASPKVAIWSGIARNLYKPTFGRKEEGICDFSAFMVRPQTIEKHGWFDENFKPAYFEDNDYHARVTLGGDTAGMIHDAHFHHVKSMTIQEDAEQAHHVNAWHGKNRDYFAAKWGVTVPAGSEKDILRLYYPSPFNVPGRPLHWWAPPES
jgi:hypothetical protein